MQHNLSILTLWLTQNSFTYYLYGEIYLGLWLLLSKLSSRLFFLAFQYYINAIVSPYQKTFNHMNIDSLVKSPLTAFFVIPAKARIQWFQMVLDACLRRHDEISDFLRMHQYLNFNVRTDIVIYFTTGIFRMPRHGLPDLNGLPIAKRCMLWWSIERVCGWYQHSFVCRKVGRTELSSSTPSTQSKITNQHRIEILNFFLFLYNLRLDAILKDHFSWL